MSIVTQDSLAGCLDISEIPVDWAAQGLLIYKAANGWCYPVQDGVIQYYAQYGYNPKLATGAIFSAIFGILMIIHIILTIMSKRKWMYVVALGAGGELAGWVGRTLSGKDNSASVAAGNYFLDQIVSLTISPVFFSAACYGIFVILVSKLSPETSRFKPKYLTWTFVGCDIVSLVLQAAGGGMTASANTQASQNTGTHIFLGGIIFQLVIMVVFSVVAVDYFYRLHKSSPTNELFSSRKYQTSVIGLALASFTIILRGGYRSAELAGGWRGHLMVTEGYFLGFDATAMVLCVAILAFTHPCFTLPRPSGKKASRPTSIDTAVDNAPARKWYQFGKKEQRTGGEEFVTKEIA